MPRVALFGTPGQGASIELDYNAANERVRAVIATVPADYGHSVFASVTDPATGVEFGRVFAPSAVPVEIAVSGLRIRAIVDPEFPDEVPKLNARDASGAWVEVPTIWRDPA